MHGEHNVKFVITIFAITHSAFLQEIRGLPTTVVATQPSKPVGQNHSSKHRSRLVDQEISCLSKFHYRANESPRLYSIPDIVIFPTRNLDP